MFDVVGPLRTDRTDLTPITQPFATSRDINSLADAFTGADVFVGLSKGNIVGQDLIR
jgi:malate dehydrogenase (oxaloacetate-decarboxylating)(NADP+)